MAKPRRTDNGKIDKAEKDDDEDGARFPREEKKKRSFEEVTV